MKYTSVFYKFEMIPILILTFMTSKYQKKNQQNSFILFVYDNMRINSTKNHKYVNRFVCGKCEINSYHTVNVLRLNKIKNLLLLEHPSPASSQSCYKGKIGVDDKAMRR